MKLNFKALVCFRLVAFSGLAYASGSGCSSGCSESSSGCSPACSVSCSNDSSCSSSTQCGNAICKTVLLPFSQADNRARDYRMFQTCQFLPNEDDINWHADIAVEFQQNFKE